MNCEDKKPADDDRGLRCWKCGGQRFWVVYTRPARDCKVVRRRECKCCKQRITTWERAIGGG